MPKKGENIYKRKDGRWEGRYIKNRDSKGRIIYGYTYGKRYLEVKSKLIVLKAQYAESKNKKLFDRDMKEWTTYWLYHHKKNTVKQSTFFNYEWLIDKYILSYFGEKRLFDLDSEDIRSYVKFLKELNLSYGTMNNVFILLKKILEEANTQNIIASNPCQNIKIPYKKCKSRKTSLTSSEQKKLEQFAFQEKGCSAIILALYSGLRIGEISGLKWSDIDFETGIIYVNRTIYRVNSKKKEGNKTEVFVGIPKTDNSYRIVPLAENLKKYLLTKKVISMSSYVVSCKNKMTEPRVIRYRFKKVVKAAGIQNIRFHSLRHTFATRCLENGVDISSLSKLLGHTSAKMTLDTYADSLLESRQKAIYKIDQLMSEKMSE
ncbi:tyrosine-type recombinase/integrase [Enterococcus quebecensis]|uniref:Integrase n=1 Tax=Enterococcus quebecensis TaxID=903983 RepID=A0A1E5H2P3_9ENTE|nr:site-specific integrase [Enterococcus quebecensis]OEG19267.1 hypothetical protein BCR23_00835 [Enterococcus quebecensis]OJG75820.1 hypothetical protein RV12_GL000159 [Enterococcus quebecensis]